jgi:hypothetical protein
LGAASDQRGLWTLMKDLAKAGRHRSEVDNGQIYEKGNDS